MLPMEKLHAKTSLENIPHALDVLYHHHYDFRQVCLCLAASICPLSR